MNRRIHASLHQYHCGWLQGKHIRFCGSWLHGAPDLGLCITQKDDALSEDDSPNRGRRGGRRSNQQQSGFVKKGGRREKRAEKTRSKRRPQRVSLLVNVWVDGAPGLAAPLPPVVAAKLSPCLSKVPFRLLTDQGKEPSASTVGKEPANCAQPKRKSHRWPVAVADSGDCREDGVDSTGAGPSRATELSIRIPVFGSVPAGATIPLHFAAGEASLG